MTITDLESRKPRGAHRRWMSQIRSHVSDLMARHPPDGRPLVAAVLLPLTLSEHCGLVEELGPRWQVVDGRRVDDADVVLMFVCSPQTTAAVRGLFPTARLIVVDSASDDDTPSVGPVRRTLNAGADVYTVEAGPSAA